ncbi:MAG: chromate transporter [Eubacteriaceae bacterium]|jgi:chromate transporter|nr:chromate transporter [Eubacteriaceae bacterium]
MIKLFQLFVTFAKIGIFGFGGGLAILPLIYQGIQKFGIMSAHEFAEVVAISQATPGPIAVNAATYVGLKYAGFAGAATATIGVAVPSFILVMITMKYLDKYKESKGLQAVFDGIRPATAGLIASALVFVGETALFAENTFEPQLIPILIFAAVIVAAGKFKVSPIILIIATGILGAFICG